METDKTAPRALREVWEWREKALRSLEHLPTLAEKIAEIQRRTQPQVNELEAARKARLSVKPAH